MKTNICFEIDFLEISIFHDAIVWNHDFSWQLWQRSFFMTELFIPVGTLPRLWKTVRTNSTGIRSQGNLCTSGGSRTWILLRIIILYPRNIFSIFLGNYTQLWRIQKFYEKRHTYTITTQYTFMGVYKSVHCKFVLLI